MVSVRAGYAERPTSGSEGRGKETDTRKSALRLPLTLVYTLLAGYDHNRADGWFFLAVAGRTPLKAEDLAPYWQVVKSGPVYLAFSQRHFSYHLAQGEGSEPPHGCDWPRLKAPPGYFAFVGPSVQAVETQVCLALEQYRPDLSPETVLLHAIHVPDETGRGPDALLVQM